jgi:phytanoyl-CoA dioxygenase PhyH
VACVDKLALAPGKMRVLANTDTNLGFAIFPAVLDLGAVHRIAAAVEGDVPARNRAGVRHLMSHPLIAGAARDPRLLAIASGFVGPAPIAFRATLFDKSGARNWLIAWHQDTALPVRDRVDAPGWGPWSIKDGIQYGHAPADALSRIVALRIHLDDSGRANGPLRVLPGTHTLGVLSDSQVQRLAREIQPVECLVPSCGVIAMRPLILHASSKVEVDRPRRVLHVEYVDALALGDGVELTIA